MTLDELLAELDRSGVRVSADGDKLLVRAPEGVLTPSLRDALTRHKPELLQRAEAAPPVTPRGSRLERVPRSGSLPLSFAQQRLWFLDQLGAGVAYSVPWVWRLDGSLNVAALESSLNEVVRRHEALRTTFPARDGRPEQVVAPELRVPLPVVDLRCVEDASREEEARRLVEEEALRPFDLANGPLLRGRLLRLRDDGVPVRLQRPSHRLRRLVGRSARQRADRALRRLRGRRQAVAPRARRPVRGLRAVAAALVRREEPRAPARLLA